MRRVSSVNQVLIGLALNVAKLRIMFLSHATVPNPTIQMPVYQLTVPCLHAPRASRILLVFVCAFVFARPSEVGV